MSLQAGRDVLWDSQDCICLKYPPNYIEKVIFSNRKCSYRRKSKWSNTYITAVGWLLDKKGRYSPSTLCSDNLNNKFRLKGKSCEWNKSWGCCATLSFVVWLMGKSWCCQCHMIAITVRWMCMQMWAYYRACLVKQRCDRYSSDDVMDGRDCWCRSGCFIMLTKHPHLALSQHQSCCVGYQTCLTELPLPYIRLL